MRALRQRLQALKQLRTWTAPGTAGSRRDSDGGANAGGVGGVEEVAGIGRGGHASSQGREDALIGDGESALIKGAIDGTAHSSRAAADRSREVTRKDNHAALKDGENHVEGLGSDCLGRFLPSAENDASGHGRDAESGGNGSDVGQAGGLDEDGGVMHRTGRDRISSDHLSDDNTLSSSSHDREKTVRYGSDDVGKSGELEEDLMEDGRLRRLYHGPGDSPPRASSWSAVRSNAGDYSAKEKLLERAGASRGREVFNSNSRGRHNELKSDGSIAERNGEQNDGVANGDGLGLHGGLHGASIAGESHTKRGRGDQEHHEYASTKTKPDGARGDVGNRGVANDDNSVLQVRGDEQGGGMRVGVFHVENTTDANGHQNTARPSAEDRQGKAAVRSQPSGEGAVLERNNESSRSANTNYESRSNNKHGGEVHRVLARHDATGGVSARGRTGPNSGDEDPNIIQDEVLGVATGDHARAPGDIDFDWREAKGQCEPRDRSSDLRKRHESKDSDPGLEGGSSREGTSQVLVAEPQACDAAGEASGHEGKEDDRALQTSHEVSDRWAPSAPGSVHGDGGALLLNPEESSLQDDGSSAVSSISSGQLRGPSPAKRGKAGGTRAEREQQEQEQEDGLEARAVSGGVTGRRKRKSAVAGTGEGSYAASSSADKRVSASRRQVGL